MAVTPILGITQVAPNQNNKEVTINDGFSIVERSLNDQLVVNLTSANADLTNADFKHNGVFVCSGHTVARELTFSNQKRIFMVKNAGTGVVTVKTNATPGTTVAVPVGSLVMMYCDGSFNLIKIADSAASALSPTFLALTDTPSSFSGQAGKGVRVNAGATALEFYDVGGTFTGLLDVPDSYTGFGGYYPRIKSDQSGIEFVTANPGGETDFILLADVPSSYTAQGGKIVRVKATADGLEFVAKNGLISFGELSDAPDSFSGQAGKIVAVNGAGSALEFVDYPDLSTYRTIAFPGTNLSFESGDLTGWTITDGATLDHTVTTTLDGVSAAEGTYWYAYYTGSDNASEIQRVFDLTSIASNDELDDGAKIEVSFKHIALQATSRVKMTLVARNDALSTIGSVDTGWLTSVATNAFDLATMSFSVPSGTRTVLMKIATDDPGTSCKAGVDQILPILKTREGISFLSLPDTPSAYTGAESKLVRVNAGGTGLEFWSLSTTFLAASDTPSSYGGQTLKLVRVNAAETALEFVAAYTVPAGGTTGQALVKSSNADGAVGWASISTSSIALDDLTDVATSGAATGKVLTYDGSSWVPAAVVRPIAFFFTSTPASNEVLALYTACESISLPANFTGAVGNVGTNPTGSFVLNVQKNGATVGTITIATGGGFTFATSGGSAVSLVSGDQLKVVAPASADATIANVSITLKGTAS